MGLDISVGNLNEIDAVTVLLVVEICFEIVRLKLLVGEIRAEMLDLVIDFDESLLDAIWMGVLLLVRDIDSDLELKSDDDDSVLGNISNCNQQNPKILCSEIANRWKCRVHLGEGNDETRRYQI